MNKDNENIEPDNSQIKILYVGSDQNYFTSLQESFVEAYPKEKFKFSNLLKDISEKKSVLLYKISMDAPHVIFLDYSQHTNSMLILARNLKREFRTKRCTVIGLLENLDSKQVLLSSLSFGININLIKGLEKSNAIHHSMIISFPDIAKDTEYALTKEVVKLNAVTLFRLSFLTEKYIHMESGLNFDKGTPAKVISKLNMEMDLSHNYIVMAKHDYNLYSNHPYSYNLTIDHMDSSKIDFLSDKIDKIEKEIESGGDKNKLKYELAEREAEFDEALTQAEEDSKRRPEVLANWIKEKRDESLPKRTKLLMIDRDMKCLYETVETFDNFPFSIQLHSGVDKNENIIHRVQPGIIVFNLDSSDEQGEKNDLETLKFLISLLAKENGLVPILVVFNYHESLEKLKKEIGYKRVISSPNVPELSFIKECCTIYQEKHGRDKTHNPELSSAKNEERIYLGKHDPRSILYYNIPIEVTFLSETDLIFNCDIDIPTYTCLYLKVPVKMTVTVVPFKQNSSRSPESGKYYGLINGIGELEMTNLRKYINKLIFKSEKHSE